MVEPAVTSAPDAGAFPAVTAPDPSQPLQAHLQVNGGSTSCGACAVVIAQVQGGRQPYSYSWSDPTLQGPGPHQVCPSEPSEYAVVVTDSSAMFSTPEFESTTQTARASGRVDCKPPEPDAGPADFIGCLTTSMNAASPDAGAASDAGMALMCENGEGGYYSGTGLLPMPIRAGHAYTLSYDQLIPIVIGEPVVVDVYGSNTPCALDEKLTTWTLDGSWHHPGCFTPQHDYNYVLIRVYVGFTLFYLELASGATFCAGCTEGAP